MKGTEKEPPTSVQKVKSCISLHDSLLEIHVLKSRVYFYITLRALPLNSKQNDRLARNTKMFFFFRFPIHQIFMVQFLYSSKFYMPYVHFDFQFKMGILIEDVSFCLLQHLWLPSVHPLPRAGFYSCSLLYVLMNSIEQYRKMLTLMKYELFYLFTFLNTIPANCCY